MEYGTIFDIKEFSVHDGPGIRTTVFLKGCPLRCCWCHNPEGLSTEPEIMINTASCTGCGRCYVESCPVPVGGSPTGGFPDGESSAEKSPAGKCSACGKCVPLCPYGFRRIVGQKISAEELCEKILKNQYFIEKGGVTFSGGEPLMQPAFLYECLSILKEKRINTAIETCGYASSSWFEKVLGLLDLVFLDIKHTNEEKHKLYTGSSLEPVLLNLSVLKKSDVPFIIRLPLIAGINDDAENLRRTAELLADSKKLISVEILPYHSTAPAKYPMVSRKFPYDFHAPEQIKTEIFTSANIPVKVL